MRNHPDFDPSFYDLGCLGGNKTAVSGDEIIFFAENRILSKNSRVAFVAPENYVFGLLRMFEFIDQAAQTQASRDRAEALGWLDDPHFRREDA